MGEEGSTTSVGSDLNGTTEIGSIATTTDSLVKGSETEGSTTF